MIDRFNKKVAMTTDSADDDFFSDTPPVGKPNDTYAAFFARPESAVKLAAFVGDDLIETADYNDARANNGGGRSGRFVRFKAEAKPIDEIKRYIGNLN